MGFSNRVRDTTKPPQCCLPVLEQRLTRRFALLVGCAVAGFVSWGRVPLWLLASRIAGGAMVSMLFGVAVDLALRSAAMLAVLESSNPNNRHLLWLAHLLKQAQLTDGKPSKARQQTQTIQALGRIIAA